MRANFVLSGVAAGIRRNVTMTVALVLSTAIALGFVGAAILANTEITRFRTTYEDKLNVSVYLCTDLRVRPAGVRHRRGQARATAAAHRSPARTTQTTTAAQTATIRDSCSPTRWSQSFTYITEAAGLAARQEAAARPVAVT